MVADTSVDYDQVTVIEKSVDGVPEIKEKDKKVVITANANLLQKIGYFARHTDILERIRTKYPAYKLFHQTLNVKPGKIISGNALVRSESWFQKMIEDNSGAVGLDMETNGFYYAAENTLFKNKPLYISIKSVSDYGSHRNDFPDGIKDASVRVPYAIYTSANFFFHFALTCLPI
jgi:nucleoside phosphorylase